MNSKNPQLHEEYRRVNFAAIQRLGDEAGITSETDQGERALWYAKALLEAEALACEAIRSEVAPEEWAEFRTVATAARSTRATQRANGRTVPAERNYLERLLARESPKSKRELGVVVAGWAGVWRKREPDRLLPWDHPDFDAELEKLVRFESWWVPPAFPGMPVEFRPSFTGVPEGLRDLLRGRVDHLNSLGLVATNVPTDGTVHGAGSLSA